MTLKAAWMAGVCATTMGASALGPAPAHAQMSEAVVAIVNDSVISTFDVRQRANLLLISAGMQSTPEIQQRAQAQALRDLVDESLQLQETKEFDVAITPEELDRRIADIARSNNSTPEAFVAGLSGAGVNVATLRRQIEAETAWGRLMNGLYGSRLRISEQAIRETQERLALDATRPQFLISEIFLPADSEAQVPELQRGAMGLLQQMQQGVSFPLIARQFSAAPSAAAGGDIGWIAASELPPEVQVAVQSLQPGQVSVPIATPHGVYILALRDRREGLPAGSTTQVSLRQISAPAARRAALERVGRRVAGCGNLETETASIEGAEFIDLGATAESDLSEAVRARIADVAPGAASAAEVIGDSASILIVCAREAGGAGIPSRDQLQEQLFEQELALLSERYLRNLRREATIITR